MSSTVVDLEDADDAVHGRLDRRVAQVQLGRGERRLGLFDGGLAQLDLGLLVELSVLEDGLGRPHLGLRLQLA